MSKIDEMIAKLCPNGVEYKRLEEFASITRGGNFQKKDFSESGIPCIHYGQIYTRYGFFTNQTISFISSDIADKQKYAEPNDIVMAVTSENIEDVCKCVAWLGTERIAISGHSAIIHHNQNAKYLSYYFHTENFFEQKKRIAHGTKVIEVTPDKLKNILVPIPPLKIQEEIVSILDNYTEKTSELISNLEKELIARKKQYEFYRDQLLSFGKVSPPLTSHADYVEWVTIGEIAEISRGTVISKDYIRDNAGNYPVYSSQTENNGCLGYINTFKYDGAYLTWTTDGANAGTVFFRSGKFNVTNVCGLIKVINEKVNLRYLYYILRISTSKYVSRGMGNAKLMSNVMASISVPIPSLAEQERIVAILDRFDTLISDISQGIPAEIETRKKQYEFYRDKLLSFKKAG